MRVAVVEDTPDVADLISLIVEAGGHEAIVFKGGTEAMDWHGWDAVDVALVDRIMPDIVGDLVLDWLRMVHPHVHRVLITADITGAYRYGESDPGAAVVLKPFDSKVLLNLLKQFDV